MTTNIREHFVPKWGASEPETKHYNSPVVRPVSTPKLRLLRKYINMNLKKIPDI